MADKLMKILFSADIVWRLVTISCYALTDYMTQTTFDLSNVF
jgi:hypothetical protein